METSLRRAFNAALTPALFQSYRDALTQQVERIPFRLAETPVFFPPALRDAIEKSTREILAQLSEPARIARMAKAIPARLDTPRVDALPNIAQIDFAIVRGPDGQLDGRVVELQGFPSLYSFEIIQARAWRQALAAAMPEAATLVPFFDHLDEARAMERQRATVIAGEDPDHVVLLDLSPDEQKTRPDFVATRILLGIDAVCPTALVREGRKLYRMRDGVRVPVRRIYHRVVFDELEARKVALPYAYTDDLDVTWCPHPNWYWTWSKFSLLHLEHRAVPETRLLSELREVPADLDRWVLKPLFSFAGSGVKVEPTVDDLARIPDADRSGWLLQRKVDYARELLTPEGDGVAVEIRVMCMRPEGATELRPSLNLVRLSRGKMHGVDHNKDLPFTGSTVALWQPG